MNGSESTTSAIEKGENYIECVFLRGDKSWVPHLISLSNPRPQSAILNQTYKRRFMREPGMGKTKKYLGLEHEVI